MDFRPRFQSHGPLGPPPPRIHEEETTAQRLLAVLSDVADQCGADAGVLLGREEDGWRLLAVSGAATRMRVGSLFTFEQNPSLSPVYADERPPIPTLDPFIEALGPVALGDAIHCPVSTGDGLSGMLCLYSAWSRPFQPERAGRATAGAGLMASLLAEAAQAAETGSVSRRHGNDPLPTLSLAVSLLNHDLRSPLHAILGFAELLATRDGASEEDAHYAENIREGGEHLSWQLDQLVGLMRLALGERRPAPAPEALGKVLYDFGCKNVPNATVLWDADMVRTALTDLLGYAALACPNPSLVTELDGDMVQLRIGGPLEDPSPVDITFRNAAVQRARLMIAAHGGTLHSDRNRLRFLVTLPRTG